MAKEKGSVRPVNLYVVDTDILIDHLRGVKEAFCFLEDLLKKGDEPYYSTISKAEIYAGIRPGEEEKTARLFSLLNACPVSDEIAERAGHLTLRFRDSQGLELPDAIVAATSIELGCELVTRNKKHYNVADVRVLVPYKH